MRLVPNRRDGSGETLLAFVIAFLQTRLDGDALRALQDRSCGVGASVIHTGGNQRAATTDALGVNVRILFGHSRLEQGTQNATRRSAERGANSSRE